MAPSHSNKGTFINVSAKKEVRRRLRAKQQTGGLHESLTLQQAIRVGQGSDISSQGGPPPTNYCARSGNSVNGFIADRARLLGIKRDTIDVVLEEHPMHLYLYHHS